MHGEDLSHTHTITKAKNVLLCPHNNGLGMRLGKEGLHTPYIVCILSIHSQEVFLIF